MALKHKTLFATLTGLITGAMWDEDHQIDADGATMATRTDAPAAPAAGKLTLFGRTLAGGALPAYAGPSGLNSMLQPFLGRNKVGIWAPQGNSTSTTGMHLGLAAPTAIGTATARVPATTNMVASLRRLGYVSGTTAASRAGAYINGGQFWRGNAAGLGGFRAVFRWCCSDAATVAGARSFVGMVSGSGTGNANISDSTNLIGVGADSGDTNLSIFTNDGSGTATKIDLGANFPDHTLSTDAYELALFCAPNSDRIGYQVTRLNRPDIAPVVGEFTSDLPVATQLLFPMFMRSNVNTTLAVGIDIVSLYIETDT